jgi:glycine betaine/proline transport system permease protein
LGIQQVPKETVEAAQAFGATPWQSLLKVELPLSLRSIMAGVNQVIMLSLSMVVIAALIGAEGLGLIVFRGIGRLDVGLAAIGGLGIVLLAIVLDRITQALGDPTLRAEAALRRRAVLGRLWPTRARPVPEAGRDAASGQQQ